MSLSRRQKRFYEILPGTLVWLTLILSIVLSFIKPLWVIYFIIAFDLFWLFRVTHFSVFLNVVWRKYKAVNGVDWSQKVREHDGWDEIYHYVLLPTAGEPFEVVDNTFQALLKNKFPLDKFIVHLAGEERMLDTFEEISQKIRAKYEGSFFKLITTVHPDGLPGEMKCKGANTHYAGQESKKIIDELGIPYEKIMCSYVDVDTLAHPQYFAYLTYKYLTTENPTRKAYQPAVLYNNNIWEAPTFTRITAFGTVFWLLTELARPERMYTFSFHIMPYKALVDVDFW